MMSLLTGVDILTIPMNDKKVLSLFSSPEALGLHQNPLAFKTGAIALPEFGTSFVQGLLEEALPHTFNDLLIISGLSHEKEIMEKSIGNHGYCYYDSGARGLRLQLQHDIKLVLERLQ